MQDLGRNIYVKRGVRPWDSHGLALVPTVTTMTEVKDRDGNFITGLSAEIAGFSSKVALPLRVRVLECTKGWE